MRGVALGGGEERGGGGGEIGARQAEEFRPETEKRFAAGVALGHEACPRGGAAQHEQAARRIERDEALDGAMVRGFLDEVAEVFGSEFAREAAGAEGAGVDLFFVGHEERGAIGAVFRNRRGGGGMGGRSADLGEIERIAAARENAVERVVVGGGDGVEFVVVAARAGEGEAEHAASDGVDAVVEDELRCLEVALETAADGQESERAQIGFLLGGQTVGGDLFEDETVERAVAVEGLDDVVAVGVGERNAALAVGGFFRGVGVARDVEPVAAPALAVFGASEELVDECGERGGARGGSERLDAIE